MEIDPRIRNLSYSSRLTLNACPRKFQLYKLGASQESPSESDTQSVTFAYGHVVGLGIQLALEHRTISQIYMACLMEWDCDLFATITKSNKSFWSAIQAVRQFISLRENGYLSGYELVYYNGKPATELSFRIDLPEQFYYRGFVDAVLQHSETGKVLVLECKTTGSGTVNPAQYKNSSQAIGYSIVLDAIFPNLSSYEVLYLVYLSKAEEFIQLPFEKSYYQRALWIRELLLDVDRICMYENAGIYSMHGESCYSFYRECEYYNLCTLSTQHLTAPLDEAGEKKLEEELNDFQIQISFIDLIKAQVSPTPAPTVSAETSDTIL